MKLGIIFKKQFHDKYGAKKEFYGDVITMKRVSDLFMVHNIITEENTIGVNAFPVEAIQLIYLGEWNK